MSSIPPTGSSTSDGFRGFCAEMKEAKRRLVDEMDKRCSENLPLKCQGAGRSREEQQRCEDLFKQCVEAEKRRLSIYPLGC